MSTSRCASAVLVERHFAGSISPADERRLREHLPGCTACGRLYARHLVLARLDPAALSAEDRIGRGLGIARPRRAWLPQLGLVTAALAAALLFLTVGRPARVDDGFVARGGAVHTAELRVFRLPADGGKAVPVDGKVRADDELAFAYTNPGGAKHLYVFAVDAAGQVYWYAPAWIDAATDPVGLTIAHGPELVELDTAVRHELAGARVTLHALFTDRPFSVRQIETVLALAPATLRMVGRPHRRFPLEVER